MKSKVLEKELDFIKDGDIRSFVENALNNLPDYFWEVPASSSGKYHPAYALGDGGLVRHTIAATNIAEMLLGLEQYKKIFNEGMHDCIIGSILLHDGFKQGKDSASHHTVKEHAIICSEWVKNEFYLDSPISKDERELIGELVRTHMGEWDEENKPHTPSQKFVHMCDYLASRKTVLFDFQDRVTGSGKAQTNSSSVSSSTGNSSSIEILAETYTMPFGKHKGRLVKDLAVEEPKYLAWALDNMSYLNDDAKLIIKAALGQKVEVKAPVMNEPDPKDDLPF